MNSLRPPGSRPAADAADTVSLLGTIDGSTVTVGTQPGPSGAGEVVLLRIQSPMLDVVTASFLTADEVDLLVAALSTAALAVTGRAADAGGESAAGAAGGGRGGRRGQHVVCASEGVTATELRHALAGVPGDGRLTDFVSDADVVLVFTPPGAAPEGAPERVEHA
jgi:uncharacterized repeat protein (TIGR03917 family)